MSSGTLMAGIHAQRFLQTPFWASFKQAHGWKALYFVSQNGILKQVDSYAEESGADYPLTVLVRSFSLKVAKMTLAYIPMAPEKMSNEEEAVYIRRICSLALHGLKQFLPRNTVFIRYDCPLDFADCAERDSFVKQLPAIAKEYKLPIRSSSVAVQPPDTTILSLDKSQDELLAAMKNKWRYNIRLAAKKGVTVSKYYGGEADFEQKFDAFYSLFEQTSKRDGVNFHAKSYYIDLIRRSCEAHKDKNGANGTPLITLYLAEHEGDYLAGIITLFCPREAVYLYGASGNVKRNYMPAYLLQWTAICDAKDYGCPAYDFYGMPPTDNENHPMHGLYLFKTGFGGAIVHRPGSFDIPLRPAVYALYTAAEKARAFFFRKVVKKLKGRN